MEPLAVAAQTLQGSSQSQVSGRPPVSGRSQVSRPVPPLVPQAGVDSLEGQLQKLASAVSSLQATVAAQSEELAVLRSVKRSFEAEKENAKRCKTFFCEQIQKLHDDSTAKDAAMAWHAQTLKSLLNLAKALSDCLPDWHARWAKSKAAGVRSTYERYIQVDQRPI